MKRRCRRCISNIFDPALTVNRMASFTWAQLIVGNLITSVVAAFVGAASAYFFQTRLSRRNAQVGLLLNACESVDTCTQRAAEYWLTSTTDETASTRSTDAFEVKRLFESCANSIELLKGWNLLSDFKEVDRLFTLFHNTSTAAALRVRRRKKTPKEVRKSQTSVAG